MITALTGLVLIVAIFAVVLFIARRLLRLAIKLALIGAVLIALFGGGLFGWWRGWFESSSRRPRPLTQTNHSRSANQRPGPR